MAGLLQPDISRARDSRTLLLSALALVVVLGSAFAFYFRHENHADVEVTGIRSLTVPLHTIYTHKGKVVGTDTPEDSLYVLAAVNVRDRADVPVFLKDLTAGLTLPDGSLVEATRVKAKDMDRVLEVVPALKPAIRAIGLPALQPEQTIAPHTAISGYVLLQINGLETMWTKRKEATLTLDFYHQTSVTVTLQ